MLWIVAAALAFGCPAEEPYVEVVYEGLPVDHACLQFETEQWLASVSVANTCEEAGVLRIDTAITCSAWSSEPESVSCDGEFELAQDGVVTYGFNEDSLGDAVFTWEVGEESETLAWSMSGRNIQDDSGPCHSDSGGDAGCSVAGTTSPLFVALLGLLTLLGRRRATRD